MKTKKPPAKKYRATLNMLGRRFIGVGPSTQEAIADLNPGITNYRGILTVENLKADVSQERIIQPNVLKRLFNTAGLSREIVLKQVSQLFNV